MPLQNTVTDEEYKAARDWVTEQSRALTLKVSSAAIEATRENLVSELKILNTINTLMWRGK